MKNATQKIKSYAVNVNVVNNNNLQKRMIHYIAILFFALVLVYVFILMNMFWNITARKSLQADARNLSNVVGSLELQYLALSSEVDIEMSKQMGFHEIKPTFANSSSSVLGSLAKVTNEI